MATSTAYSFLNVSATVDGQIVQGLWEGDDAIIVTMASDAGTGLVGADGSGIFSISASRAARISRRWVAALRHSRSHSLIAFLARVALHRNASFRPRQPTARASMPLCVNGFCGRLIIRLRFRTFDLNI